MNETTNSGWYKPKIEYGNLAELNLHDSELVGVAINKLGAMDLRFACVEGEVVSVGVCAAAKPLLIASNQIMPLILSVVSVHLVSDDVANFVGILTEEDLSELNGMLAIPGARYEWLLILVPNYGGGAILAGMGSHESMMYCAVADDARQLPSIEDLPPVL